MGGQFSKRTGQSLPVLQLDSNLQYTAEMSSNEATFRLDPNLQSFYSTLQVVTNPLINTIAPGVELRALSFDSLKEVAGSKLEVNQEVVQGVLDGKKDVWKDRELFQLVKDYFDNSLQTLESFRALDECPMKVRGILRVALEQFKKDEEVADDKKNLATLEEELKNFNAAGNPLTENIFQAFVTVHKHQVLMLKLGLRKDKLDKKLESVNTWRKVSIVTFGATFAATITCSVVAIAMAAFAVAAPHVVAAVAAAASIPVGSFGTWFNSLWTDHENALKAHQELISSMQAGTYFAIKNLDASWVPVICLSREIQTLMQNADFALREGEEVKIVVEEIEKKLGVFTKNIEDFSEQAERCSQPIHQARTVVLERVSKHPNN